LPGDLVALFEFLYPSGVRFGEVIQIGWNEVDLKEGLIRLNASQTKNKIDRVIPISEEVSGLLKKQFQVGKFVFSV
jgi:integrase